MNQTESSRRRRWFFARSMARAYREWLQNRSPGSRKAKVRPLFAEALEPRVLFSAAPAPEVSDAVEEEAMAPDPVAQSAGALVEDLGSLDGIEFEEDIDADFSEDDLERLAAEAVNRWEASGLTEDQIEALERINYVVSDLEGEVIGSAEGDTVSIDFDAAGRDWFIDDTEWLDEEYSEMDGVLRAINGDDVDGLAYDGVDLLSVIMHEQGHILGLYDADEALDGGVMFGEFSEGERRVVFDGQADGAAAGSLEGVHFASAGLTQVTVADQSDWDAAVATLDATREVVFSGAGGTITVSGSVTVGALSFQSGAYVLDGGSLTIAGTDGCVHTDVDAEITSVLEGAASELTKTGTATLTISGANTYGGETTVSEGVLKLGSNTALGNAIVLRTAGTPVPTSAGTTVEAGAALDLGNITFGANEVLDEVITISGSGIAGQSDQGAIFKSGGGSLVNRGLSVVVLAADASIGSSASRFDIGTSISGAHTLTKVGNEFIGFRGAPNFTGVIVDGGNYGAAENNGFRNVTGTVTVNAGGTISAFSTKNNIDGDFVLNGGRFLSNQSGTDNVARTVVFNGTLEINGTGNVFEQVNATGSGATGTSTMVIGATVTGSGSVSKTGTGFLRFDGDMSAFDGTINLDSSVTSLGAADRIGDNAIVNFNGGTLDMAGFDDTVSTVAFNGVFQADGTYGSSASAAANPDDTRFEAASSGVLTALNLVPETTVTVSGGQIVITDNRTGISDDSLTITESGGFIIISDANLDVEADTANGVEQVDAQTVRIAVANETAGLIFSGLGGTDTVTIGSDLTLDGPLNLDVENVVVNGAVTAPSGTVTVSSGITFDSGSDFTFTPVIAGAGTVTKQGSGILTLDGDNTYMGATTVSAGILKLGSDTALGDSGAGTTVADGAALDINGQAAGLAGGLAETVTISGDGIAGDPNSGALINSVGYNNRGFGTVILAADASIGNNGGRFDIRVTANSGAGGPFTLTKVGNNLVGVADNPISRML